MKWYITSICLVLECYMGFLVKLMELVLSQNMGTQLKSKQKSCKKYFIHKSWTQHTPAAMYSAFAIDNEMALYFLLNHDTKQLPRKWQVLWRAQGICDDPTSP